MTEKPTVVVDFVEGEVLYLPFSYGSKNLAVMVTFVRVHEGKVEVNHKEGMKAFVPVSILCKLPSDAIKLAEERNKS